MRILINDLQPLMKSLKDRSYRLFRAPLFGRTFEKIQISDVVDEFTDSHLLMGAAPTQMIIAARDEIREIDNLCSLVKAIEAGQTKSTLALISYNDGGFIAIIGPNDPLQQIGAAADWWNPPPLAETRLFISG